ncbi:DUF6482 family protein [Ningiella sp. W23]|uniref:DUF6482 family protein n=1 Tax=Ningiella sp. W23 TaxID=3023715 RepID=UPI0037571C42
MKLYIESIEGGTFIAKIVNKSSEQILTNNTRKTQQFESIKEIKDQVVNESFDSVWLKQATPYDEMCGLAHSPEKLLLKLDW